MPRQKKNPDERLGGFIVVAPVALAESALPLPVAADTLQKFEY